jgi:hypothetical protein
LRRRHPFSSPHVPPMPVALHPYYWFLLIPAAYLAPLMLRCLRRRKRSITFSTTTVLTHRSRLSPAPTLGLMPSVRHLFPAPLCYPATIVLSSSRHLYLWLLLYPLATAFSSSLGAWLTSPTFGCLLHLVTISDCDCTLLFLFFSAPVLHPYHRIFIILGCALRTRSNSPLSTPRGIPSRAPSC